MSSPRVAGTATAGLLLALLAAGLWGVSGAIAAHAFSAISPPRVAEARALFAVALLVPYAGVRRRLSPQGAWLWLAILGINLAVVNVTFYWSLDRLGVGPGATIQFLGPIIVLGWMAKVQRRPVGRAAWGAALLAVAGVALVTEAWDVASLDPLGVAAGLASAVTFASYLVLGEHLAGRLRPVTVITWGFIFASVVWLIVQPLWTFPFAISGRTWLELVWIGVAGTALPFIAQFSALRRVASGLVGVVATTEPVIAAAAAWIMLDQVLGGAQILGGAMVVVAVASIQRWGIAELEVPLLEAR